MVAADAHLAPLHASRVGFWRVLPSRRRTVKRTDRLHDSVRLRMQATEYRPEAAMPPEPVGRIAESG